MYLTPFTSLTWAYQLHYYLCFRTYRRIPFFAKSSPAEVVKAALNEISERHDYHLLEMDTYPNQVRCLVSLQPTQKISKVIQTLKANSTRECVRQLGWVAPVWAGGYLARSVGEMHIDAVRQYLEQQSQHHGYETRLRPPVYRYRASAPVSLTAEHSSFELNHHLVFATQYRKGVFTSTVGEKLGTYWLLVARKRGFAIDQISIVPDHVHLLVRVVPKMSIEECALLLLNNGQQFMGQRFPELLVQVGLTQLWQPSAYAGTCGEMSTALVKHWLAG